MTTPSSEKVTLTRFLLRREKSVRRISYILYVILPSRPRSTSHPLLRSKYYIDDSSTTSAVVGTIPSRYVCFEGLPSRCSNSESNRCSSGASAPLSRTTREELSAWK